MSATYEVIEYEHLEAIGRYVEFVVDVDAAANDTAYRVRGVYDCIEQSFDELVATHEWSSDLEEHPIKDPAIKRELERFVECCPDVSDRLHRQREWEIRETDPR
jgi:hypothetical protein